MRLNDIALNNLRRRKGKMLFLVGGLVIAVATVVSLISLTNAMQSDIQDKLDQFGANIVITPKSDDLTLTYGGVTIATAAVGGNELKMSDIAAIRTIKNSANLAAIAPKVVGAVETTAGKALLVGVDFENELNVKKWWEIGGLAPKTPGQVLVGSEASKRYGITQGQEITVNGKAMPVTGVLKPTGSVDDSLIFTDLATAQTILNKPDAVSFIEIAALCKACPIEEIIAQINEKLPGANVAALAQTIKSRQQTVDQLTSFSAAVSVVLVLISGMIVLTTMMSSVNERTREIGIFRAIGFRRSHIVRIIMSEAAVTSAFGGVVGWVLGAAASIILSQRVLNTSAIHFDPWLAPVAIALAIIIGIASSLYPATRASNLDPAEALRSL